MVHAVSEPPEDNMAVVYEARDNALVSELLEEMKDGQTLIITRHGHEVAHVAPVVRPKKKLSLRKLAEFRATMPRLSRPSVELLREDRDEGY